MRRQWIFDENETEGRCALLHERHSRERDIEFVGFLGHCIIYGDKRRKKIQSATGDVSRPNL